MTSFDTKKTLKFFIGSSHTMKRIVGIQPTKIKLQWKVHVPLLSSNQHVHTAWWPGLAHFKNANQNWIIEWRDKQSACLCPYKHLDIWWSANCPAHIVENISVDWSKSYGNIIRWIIQSIRRCNWFNELIVTKEDILKHNWLTSRNSSHTLLHTVPTPLHSFRLMR